MLRSLAYSFMVIIIFLTSACGLLQAPPAQPQPSATAGVVKATAMSELPPTWTAAPTLTPTTTLTPEPTPTPTQDPADYQIGLAMTPVVLDYPIGSVDRAGWKQLEGKTATLSIPPSFQVVDFANVMMKMMFGVMQAFAEGFMEFAGDLGEGMGVTPEATLEQPNLGESPELDFILAMEESSQSAIILTGLDRVPDSTTEDLLNQALSDSGTDFTPDSRDVYSGSPYPMERVILDVLDEELGPGKQIIYVIMGDQTAWNVVFTTPAGLFDQNLPIFESVIESFAPLP